MRGHLTIMRKTLFYGIFAIMLEPIVPERCLYTFFQSNLLLVILNLLFSEAVTNSINSALNFNQNRSCFSRRQINNIFQEFQKSVRVVRVNENKLIIESHFNRVQFIVEIDDEFNNGKKLCFK